jgi:methylmalonyl-CoA/ethylmalonyl-CoA epimerase
MVSRMGVRKSSYFYNAAFERYKRGMTDDMQFDHLGVVVKSLAKGRAALEAVFRIGEWTEEFRDTANGVLAQFGRDPAGVCYELLEPLDSGSPVYPALEGNKAILNHVAYLVRDLDGHAARLERAGCARTSEPKPALAYGGKRVQFFVTPLRFVVELVEAPAHAHRFAPGGA